MKTVAFYLFCIVLGAIFLLLALYFALPKAEYSYQGLTRKDSIAFCEQTAKAAMEFVDTFNNQWISDPGDKPEYWKNYFETEAIDVLLDDADACNTQITMHAIDDLTWMQPVSIHLTNIRIGRDIVSAGMPDSKTRQVYMDVIASNVERVDTLLNDERP